MSVEKVRLAMAATPAPSQTDVFPGGDMFLTAAGDFTGGASEDLFTLTDHGLTDGDRVMLVGESAAGVVTGAVGDMFIAKVLSSSTFQLTSDGSTVIENSADGTATFAKAATGAVDTSNADAVTDPTDTDAGWIEIS